MSKVYRILEGRSLSELEDQVTKYVNDGWELVGGVAVKAEDESSYVLYCQAVIKEEA